MVNSIRNNTTSKISAKKCLNTLIEIRNAEKIKYKKRIPKQKELLSLFNNLSHIILTDKTLESESQENENEKVGSREEDNENEDDDYKNENEDEYKIENDDEIIKILLNSYEHVETVDQNEKNIIIT